jgi:transcriptional regulator with XRE-family HTH domain
MCEAIGRRIRDVREHRKLSIEELSKSSNLTVSIVTEAETKGQVTLSDLVKLGVALRSDTAQGLELMFKVPRFSTIEEYIEFCKNDKGTANMFDLLNS